MRTGTTAPRPAAPSIAAWLATGAPVLEQLPGEPEHEARVVDQVPPPEAARLLDEPERPLEPDALERAWRLALEAGVEVEGGADTDQHRRYEALAHGEHELLLEGDAEADPDHVGRRGVELAGDRVGLVAAQLAEGTRAGADDAQARVAPRELGAQRLERRLAAAVQEEGLAGAGGAPARLLHQVGAVDAAREVLAEQVHGPYERLAVGDREVGGEHRPAQLGVLLGHHDGMDGRDTDVRAPARGDRGVDPVQRPRVVRHRQRDPEDLLRGEGRHWPGGGRDGDGHGAVCCNAGGVRSLRRHRTARTRAL